MKQSNKVWSTSWHLTSSISASAFSWLSLSSASLASSWVCCKREFIAWVSAFLRGKGVKGSEGERPDTQTINCFCVTWHDTARNSHHSCFGHVNSHQTCDKSTVPDSTEEVKGTWHVVCPFFAFLPHCGAWSQAKTPSCSPSTRHNPRGAREPFVRPKTFSTKQQRPGDLSW